MALSSGKFAKFISDRSGQEFPYSEMVIEWNGARVHTSEFEKKHPQLEPKSAVADPEALYEPRPNNDVEVGFGYVLTNNDKILGSSIEGFTMTSSLGEVTIS